MSYGLDYPKEAADAGAAHADGGSLGLPCDSATAARADGVRRVHRFSVLGALLIASAILGTFNSGALVRYTYDLAESGIGVGLLEFSERWHRYMERQRMTALVEHIRGAVGAARNSTWQDVTLGLGRIAASDDDPEPAAADAAEEARPDGTLTEERAMISPRLSAASPTSP